MSKPLESRFLVFSSPAVAEDGSVTDYGDREDVFGPEHPFNNAKGEAVRLADRIARARGVDAMVVEEHWQKAEDCGPVHMATAAKDFTPAPHVEQVCASCEGTNVLADAYAAWNTESQEWGIDSLYDKGAHCNDCGGETRIVERPIQRKEPSVKSYGVYTGFDIFDDDTPGGEGKLQQSFDAAASPEDASDQAVELALSLANSTGKPIVVSAEMTDGTTRGEVIHPSGGSPAKPRRRRGMRAGA